MSHTFSAAGFHSVYQTALRGQKQNQSAEDKITPYCETLFYNLGLLHSATRLQLRRWETPGCTTLVRLHQQLCRGARGRHGSAAAASPPSPPQTPRGRGCCTRGLRVPPAAGMRDSPRGRTSPSSPGGAPLRSSPASPCLRRTGVNTGAAPPRERCPPAAAEAGRSAVGRDIAQPLHRGRGEGASRPGS